MGVGVVLEDDGEKTFGEKWLCLDSDLDDSGKLLAILLTSIKIGLQQHITFKTRLEVAIEVLTNGLNYKEDAGFLGIYNVGLLRVVVDMLRMHLVLITFIDLAYTQATPTKSKASLLAKEAMNNMRPMSLPLIPIELHLTGTKLSKIT